MFESLKKFAADMHKAVTCLSVQLPAEVHTDVKARWDALMAELDKMTAKAEDPEAEPAVQPFPDLAFPKIRAEGEVMIVTFDDWFHAPDGNTYKSAWGRVRILPVKQALGFEPKQTANWFVVIGEGDHAIVVAGCRVHYAVICHKRPGLGQTSGHIWRVPGTPE